MSKSKTRIVEEIGVQKQLLTLLSAMVIAITGWLGPKSISDSNLHTSVLFAILVIGVILIFNRLLKIQKLLVELNDYE